MEFGTDIHVPSISFDVIIRSKVLLVQHFDLSTNTRKTNAILVGLSCTVFSDNVTSN